MFDESVHEEMERLCRPGLTAWVEEINAEFDEVKVAHMKWVEYHFLSDLKPLDSCDVLYNETEINRCYHQVFVTDDKKDYLSALKEMMGKVERFIHTAHPRVPGMRRILFWRRMPEVHFEKDLDSLEELYKGYCRLSIMDLPDKENLNG